MDKKLNLCGLLKGYEGESFYYTLYDEYMTLNRVYEWDEEYPLEFTTEKGLQIIQLTKYGNVNPYRRTGEVVVYPSKTQRNWLKEKEYYPTDTPMMCSNDKENWALRYYCSFGCVFQVGMKSKETNKKETYDYIIPFKDFNTGNIEESLNHNIVQ